MNNPCNTCKAYRSKHIVPSCDGTSPTCLEYKKYKKQILEKMKTVNISPKATPTRGNEMTKDAKNKILDFFEIKKTGGDNYALGDFADKDFTHWLRHIHGCIQTAMSEKLIDGKKIENYANITLYIGGQRVDIAIVKDGCKSPHELLQEFKKSAEPIKGDEDFVQQFVRIDTPDHIHCPNCNYPICKKDFDEMPGEATDLLMGKEE